MHFETATGRRECREEMLRLLRAVDKEFTATSLRRGTLRSICDDPENDLETAMGFSGHTRETTTLHYTNQHAAQRQEKQLRAARVALDRPPV